MTEFKKPFIPYSRTVNSPKTAAIERATKEKDAKIRSYTDKKSQSIAISSAFNGSWSMVVALVSTGQCERKDIWIEHEAFYQEYLQKFNDKQNEGQEKQQEEKTIQLEY